MRNLLVRVAKAAQSLVATFVRSIFTQPDAESVHAQRTRIVEHLMPRYPEPAKLLADEILTFTAFPKEHWKQIWSNNPQERLNREIRRHGDVVGIFPNRPSVIRLVGAVLAEINDDWAMVRRYLTLDNPAKEEVKQLDALPSKHPTACVASN